MIDKFVFLFYRYSHPVVDVYFDFDSFSSFLPFRVEIESLVITIKLFCSIKTQFMSCRKDIFVQLNDKNCQKKRQ